MIHDFRWPEPEGTAQQKLLDDVREYGCHILNDAAENRPDATAVASGDPRAFVAALALVVSVFSLALTGLDSMVTRK